jgi:hypothetical protein
MEQPDYKKATNAGLLHIQPNAYGTTQGLSPKGFQAFKISIEPNCK